MYFYHNKTSVAFPTMIHPVIEDVYTRSIINSPIFKSFDIPELKSTSIVSETWFSSMEVLGQQYSAALSGQTIQLPQSRRRPGTLYPYKTGLQKWSSWCLSRNIDPVFADVNFVLEFLSFFSEGLKLLIGTN